MDEWIGVKVSSTHAMPIASTSLMAAGVDKKKKKLRNRSHATCNITPQRRRRRKQNLNE
jgi:hypothetical protein